MCGIVALLSNEPVNQRLYDALLLLQHRGQDAAGIATLDGLQFHIHKAMGLVRDVFRTRNMRDLTGNVGIGHVRYPTQGCASSNQESQPFYVNAPYGIMLAHTGNLTNAEALKQDLYEHDHRHINTTSDSEVLLNVLANEISRVCDGGSLDADGIFKAVAAVHKRVRGSYAVVALIAGKGLLAFRDPHAIRPICFGSAIAANGEREWMVSSESVTMVGLGFKLERDLEPGEALWIDFKGNVETRQCAENPVKNPCAFEYVYFARPDSLIDGISVYGARLNLGVYLAETVKKTIDLKDVDVVMPIPDSSRPCAQELAKQLELPYREGFIKNRYIGRTFIQPSQELREKGVRMKLSAVRSIVRGKRVVLVDDSIVRGTTSRRIVTMLKEAGATEVHVRIASPPMTDPCFYGVDTSTREELISARKNTAGVCEEIGADSLVFLSPESLLKAGSRKELCMACFTGQYPTALYQSPEEANKDVKC